LFRVLSPKPLRTMKSRKLVEPRNATRAVEAARFTRNYDNPSETAVVRIQIVEHIGIAFLPRRSSPRSRRLCLRWSPHVCTWARGSYPGWFCATDRSWLALASGTKQDAWSERGRISSVASRDARENVYREGGREGSRASGIALAIRARRRTRARSASGIRVDDNLLIELEKRKDERGGARAPRFPPQERQQVNRPCRRRRRGTARACR